jgi:ferritin-like metal-binding protein YciE
MATGSGVTCRLAALHTQRWHSTARQPNSIVAIAMTTESTEQLLVDGLQELYYAEQELLDALEILAQETDNEAASEAFSEHREETKGQIHRLERIFEDLDVEAEPREEPVIDALIQEHEAFSGENDGEILDRYNMATGQKTEHYEIAAYGNVTSLAGKLGHDDAADLLEQTLREEEEALETVTEASEAFDREQIATE